MLKRFTVPLKDEVRVPEWSLRRTVTAVFEKMGVTPEDAAVGADVLVTADLRGVETHGVSNMLRAYVAQYGDGSLNPGLSGGSCARLPALRPSTPTGGWL